MIAIAHGLRSHYHQYYLYDIKNYYDKDKHCMIKAATFRCMICGKEYHERYEYKPPPKQNRKLNILERNKKKYGNQK